jgi:tRNA(adenine34) deaminase
VFSHPQAHHKPEIYGGIRERECGALLSDFMAQQRRAGRAESGV